MVEKCGLQYMEGVSAKDVCTWWSDVCYNLGQESKRI